MLLNLQKWVRLKAIQHGCCDQWCNLENCRQKILPSNVSIQILVYLKFMSRHCGVVSCVHFVNNALCLLSDLLKRYLFFLWKHDLFHGPKKIMENMVIVNINYAQMTLSGNVCDFCGGLVCEVHIIAHHRPNSHENSFWTHSIWGFDSFIFVALRFVCLHIPKDKCAARTRNNVVNTYYSEQIWTSMI